MLPVISGFFQPTNSYTSATVATGAAVSLTTNTSANITSKLLMPGRWLVNGVVDFTLTGATATSFKTGISLTSVTLPTQVGGSGLGTDPLISVPLATTALTDVYIQNNGITYLEISVPTTVYLVANVTFSVGTVSGYGTLKFVCLGN